MIIFDYLFYRVCRIQRKGGNKKPTVIGVIFVSLVILFLTPIIWVNLLDSLFGYVPESSEYFVGLFIFCLLYPYYKNKEKKLNKKFSNSIINKIPDWCFLPTFAICMFVGFWIYFKTEK